MDFNQRTQIAKLIMNEMKRLNMPVVVIAIEKDEVGFMASIANGDVVSFEAVARTCIKDYHRTKEGINMITTTRNIYFNGSGSTQEVYH